MGVVNSTGANEGRSDVQESSSKRQGRVLKSNQRWFMKR